MSERQRTELDAVIRDGTFDVGGDIERLRDVNSRLADAEPIPDDLTTGRDTLGGVPIATVDVPGGDAGCVILYFHGGAYTIGSAESSIAIVSHLARRTGSRAVCVEYRLAPEHPYPAALDDAVSAYAALCRDPARPQVALAGESAGAGLATALLITAHARGLPQPACAVLMSPWADLTLSGDSIDRMAGADPALTADGLERRAADYIGDSDPAADLISPVFADLTGIAPLLIQVGSHEILLSDALRLTSRAAAAHVPVTLQVTPRVPHVFQRFSERLDEADGALQQAAAFLTEHFRGRTA